MGEINSVPEEVDVLAFLLHDRLEGMHPSSKTFDSYHFVDSTDKTSLCGLLCLSDNLHTFGLNFH